MPNGHASYEPTVSAVLPCRNEEASLGHSIEQLQNTFSQNGISGEIIVSDSSNDSSPEITLKYNARLIKHNLPGYGRAYIEGFKAARGKYIFCADPDGSYDFTELPKFIKELENGFDLVIGNRFKGKIEKGSMPWIRRYIGNPLLSSVLRLFFGAKISDAHCGMRAIRREALEKINLQTEGMEFASEMIIKALKNGMRIKEIPIDYYKRIGKSKLRAFPDGWRHLRLMLLLSPFFLFFIPGFLMLIFGGVIHSWLYVGSSAIFGIPLFFHPMFISSLLIIVGYQTIIFAFFAKSYAILHLGETSEFINALHSRIKLETGIMIGLALLTIGAIMFVRIFLEWVYSGFGELNEIKNALTALILATLGVETIFSSFMLSIIGFKK